MESFNYIVKWTYKVVDVDSPTGYDYITQQLGFFSLEDARRMRQEVQDILKCKAFLLCNSETTRSGLNDSFLSEGF